MHVLEPAGATVPPHLRIDEFDADAKIGLGEQFVPGLCLSL